MPRVRLTDTQLANRHFAAAIQRQKAMMQYKDADICRLTGISVPTLRKRRSHPEQVTLRELRRLIAKLELTREDVCNIIGIPFQEDNRR